jgi:hypothetical protein
LNPLGYAESAAIPREGVHLAAFNRFVQAGTEPEVRDQLALTLAQAVFPLGETGLIDSSGDQITLIERMADGSPTQPAFSLLSR